MELICHQWQYMRLFPHIFGFYHMCVVKSTHNTVTISVVFTTEVCVLPYMCGKNPTPVSLAFPHMCGYFHTCVQKHTPLW